ncbi:hypothetical protein ACHAWX_005214 [Stephanocyclus meneghinianus]
MELKQAEGQPIAHLNDMNTKIGMMAHSFTTVFFPSLPEYTPHGRAGDATPASPESQIMDVPKTVGLLNGIFSLIKYGLSNCNGGFGSNWKSCNKGDLDVTNSYLSFSRPLNSITTTQDDHADAVIGELSTLLTSGRPSCGDSALRLAQQLIASSPEFHTTNTVISEASLRPLYQQALPTRPLSMSCFAGGCVSYNMLVPHTCTGTKDMHAEYTRVCEETAIKKEGLSVLEG